MELVRSGMGSNVVIRRQVPSGPGGPQRCCDITQGRSEPSEELGKGAQAGNSRCKGPGAEASSVSEDPCKPALATHSVGLPTVTDYHTRASPAQTARIHGALAYLSSIPRSALHGRGLHLGPPVPNSPPLSSRKPKRVFTLSLSISQPQGSPTCGFSPARTVPNS